MRAIVLFFLTIGMLSASANNDEDIALKINTDELHIVTTIKPIQALVLAIINGVDISQSQQLIPDFASPHHYSFKPSDIRKIKKADIIFRIDDHFEMMLNPAFSHVQNKNTPLISLADSPNINFLHSSKAHSAEHSTAHSSEHSQEEHAKEQETNEHSEHGEQHNENNLDMHIWTSPVNAIAMAKQITLSLSEINPKNQAHYKTNLHNLVNKITASTAEIKRQLSPLQNSPYIVFHDSWQYFAHSFSLTKPTVVNFHEGISVGAKTLHKVRKQIKSKNIHCVFSSTGMNQASVNVLTENIQNMKTVEIDVLARTFTINKDTYINWLNTMGQQIKHCLTEN